MVDFAIVTDVGYGMRWTRERRETSAAHADGEVVWSRRSDAGVKLAESSANDGGNQAWSPGITYKPLKTIAQGRPDDPAQLGCDARRENADVCLKLERTA